MHDEYRVCVEVSSGQAHELLHALEAVERDSQDGVPSPEHVAVTHEGGNVFLYVDSSEQAATARAAVERVLAEKSIDGKVTSWRWHPEEDRWEDSSAPLPSTPAGHDAEHARLERMETEESTRDGYPEWEVRVTLPTHHEAHEFAQRLGAEGIPVQRHWRHLALGAYNEDEANQLADRLRAEAPQGASLEVEGAAWKAWVTLNGSARPFAIFGGMAQ
jgi:hypothetical protein